MADLKTLLKGKAPEAFTAHQLIGKAHWRWERDQLHEAFLLFDAARARAEADGVLHDELAARNRAAITRQRSGVDPADGLRRLEEVLEVYAARPDAHYDRHFCEWAATELLLDAASRGAEAFAARFAELTARCRDLDLPRFPSIHPQQEALARAARDLEVAEVLAAVVPKIKARKMKRALRREVADWEAWLAARPAEAAT
jgi:hypothetical protein